MASRSDALARARERAGWVGRTGLSAVMTALVFAATMLQVQTPITRGYLNLGDSMIFVAAFLGGAQTGFIAGSIGSALADIISGYGYYAPGTFVIKGLEGFIAGYLYERLRGAASRSGWKTIVYTVSALIFIVVSALGVVYTRKYGGSTILELAGHSIRFSVPAPAWVALAAVLAGVILYAGLKGGEELGPAIIAWFIGGLWMVLGYFIYEATVVYSLGKLEGSSPLAAAAEIPGNIGQALAGVVVAAFLVSVILRARGQRE